MQPSVDVPALVKLVSEWTQVNESGVSYADAHGIPASVSNFQVHPLCEVVTTLTDYSPTGGYTWEYNVREHSRDGLGRVPRLYRGCEPGGEYGMSWTHQLDIAEGFACQTNGNVYTAQFAAEDVLMVVHVAHTGLQCLNPAEMDRKPFTEWIMRPSESARLL